MILIFKLLLIPLQLAFLYFLFIMIVAWLRDYDPYRKPHFMDPDFYGPIDPIQWKIKFPGTKYEHW